MQCTTRLGRSACFQRLLHPKSAAVQLWYSSSYLAAELPNRITDGRLAERLHKARLYIFQVVWKSTLLQTFTAGGTFRLVRSMCLDDDDHS